MKLVTNKCNVGSSYFSKSYFSINSPGFSQGEAEGLIFTYHNRYLRDGFLRKKISDERIDKKTHQSPTVLCSFVSAHSPWRGSTKSMSVN